MGRVFGELVVIMLLFACQSVQSQNLILTASSVNATLGKEFSFTCESTTAFVLFKGGHRALTQASDFCSISGIASNGSCIVSTCDTVNYSYTCENGNKFKYKVMLRKEFVQEDLHKTLWQCINVFDGTIKSNEIELNVNVPITKTIITTYPTDKDDTVSIVIGSTQQFICSTDAGRPSSRIQWYLSENNLTSSATTQPDVCLNSCAVDKIISSSILTLTGEIKYDGKKIFCSAVNINGMEAVKSQNKAIVIWYSPLTEPSITQSPDGPAFIDLPINLTCEVYGGYPLAKLSFKCENTSATILPGSSHSDKSVSIIHLTLKKEDNGKVCTCTSFHPAWLSNKSTDYTLNVRYIETVSSVKCNSSSTLELRCRRQMSDLNDIWEGWTHRFHDTTIRSMSGFVTGPDLLLTIEFCNYQDAGTYVCILNTTFGFIHTNVEVEINDAPVVVSNTFEIKDGKMLVSAFFYSVPFPADPIWHFGDKALTLSNKYRKSTFSTTVQLKLYSKTVDVSGFVSRLTVDDYTKSDDGKYLCKVFNIIGHIDSEINIKTSSLSVTDDNSVCTATILGSSLAACTVVTALVTNLITIICYRNRSKKKMADSKEKFERYEDIGMSGQPNVYDTVQ